jgi:hypothetical protein
MQTIKIKKNPAVTIRITVVLDFLAVMPCSMWIFTSFLEELAISIFRVEEYGGRTLLQNISKYLPDHIVTSQMTATFTVTAVRTSNILIQNDSG